MRTAVRSFVRLPMLLIWLTALWVTLWDDLSPGTVLGGLGVAVVVLLVARPTGVSGLERNYFRPFAALQYAAYFLVLLVKSNLLVAWEIITPGSGLNRAIIGVRMHTRSAGVVTLVANSITLTPGTVTIDVAERRLDEDTVERTLFVHVLHLDTLEDVRRDVLKLERLAVKAFGTAAELAAVDASLAAMTSPSEAAS